MYIDMDKTASEIPDFTSHELISSYHDGLREAVDFVQSMAIGTLRGQLSPSTHEKAVMGTFMRIHALACSLLRLNNKVDFNAVAGIARIVFELLIDMKLLTSSKLTQKDVDRFSAFAEVDRFRKAKKIVELQNKHPDLVNSSVLDSSKRKEFVERQANNALEKKVESLWGKNSKGKIRWPDHWSGLSIRQRAELFGPLYEQEYLEVYSLLSSYAHGGDSGYSGFTESALESVYGISLEYARKLYIEALLLCSRAFNLKKGIESFAQIVTFLKNAPNQILINYGLKKLNPARFSK
jgi:hypothetical protein